MEASAQSLSRHESGLVSPFSALGPSPWLLVIANSHHGHVPWGIMLPDLWSKLPFHCCW